MVKNENISDRFAYGDVQHRNNNLSYCLIIVFLFSIGFVIGFKYVSYDDITKEVTYQLQAIEKKIHNWRDENKRSNEF